MWSGFSIWAGQSKGEERTEGRRLWRWPPVREKEGEGASGPGLVAKVGPAFCGGQDAFSPGYGGRGLLETGHCSQPGRTRAAVRDRSQAVDFEPHTHRAQGHLGGFHRPWHGEDAGLGCSHGCLSRSQGARGPGRCLPGQATLGGLRQQDGGGEARPSPAQPRTGWTARTGDPRIVRGSRFRRSRNELLNSICQGGNRPREARGGPGYRPALSLVCTARAPWPVRGAWVTLVLGVG